MTTKPINLASFDYRDTKGVMDFLLKLTNDDSVACAMHLTDYEGEDTYIIGWSTEEFTNDELRETFEDWIND